jgi:hypothetical protein
LLSYRGNVNYLERIVVFRLLTRRFSNIIQSGTKKIWQIDYKEKTFYVKCMISYPTRIEELFYIPLQLSSIRRASEKNTSKYLT